MVCEKPLAHDRPGAQSWSTAAAESGRAAAVPFIYRDYPMVREARARAPAGDRTVRLIHGAYLQDWLLRADDANWRVPRSSAARRGRSRTSARTGATWPSSLPATASSASVPRR